MANPEVGTYKLTFRKLSPGDVCGLLRNQALNPRCNITLLWKDRKTKKPVVSLTTKPFSWIGSDTRTLRELYHLARGSDEMVVEETAPSSMRNFSK